MRLRSYSSHPPAHCQHRTVRGRADHISARTGLEIISATSIDVTNEMMLILETPKVAVSSGPFGNVVGVQLLGLIQSSSTGFRFQVALPA